MKYALIKNNIVENVIEWDGVSDFSPPRDTELHQWDGEIDIGWQWFDSAPVNPNPLPESGTKEGPSVV